MAIITFYSNEIKETGQSLSVAAIASYMAIQHNYKILVISTDFDDYTLENCFWEYDKIRPTSVVKEEGKVGIESGVEGLVKALRSNRTCTEIVKNYSRIVLRDRLDILISPATKLYKEYVELASEYVDIIQTAKRYYDLIFIDLSKKMPRKEIAPILRLSDILLLNITQKQKNLDNFIELRENNDFYKRKNVMLTIGKYDRNSKYNAKNITRYLKEKKTIATVPYNTLFFEECSEGKIIDYIVKSRTIKDETDLNYLFIKELEALNDSILLKLQELQMKL